MDRDLAEVVRTAPVALAIKVAGAVLAFGVNIVIARRLGASGAGTYYLSFALMSLCAVVGSIGLEHASLRFTAAHATRDEWDLVGGVYRSTIRIAAAASAAIAAVVLSAAPLLATHLFGNSDLTTPFRVAALGIVPFSALTLQASMLKGIKKVRQALMVDTVAVAMITLPLLFVLPRTATAALAATVGALLVVAVAGGLIWRRSVPQVARASAAYDRTELLRTGLPLLMAAVMTVVMASADTVMVGIFGTQREVGMYAVALRVLSVSGFTLIAVNQIAPAKFSALWTKGDVAGLERLARNVARLTLFAALPLLLPFIIAPGWILGLFGPQFRAAGPALLILAIGQFVNMATGSVGYLLIMTGHQKTMRNNMVLSAAFFVALNAVLIPRYGIIGAAISFAASVDLMMLSQVYLVYRKLSIWVLPLPAALSPRRRRRAPNVEEAGSEARV